MSMSKQDFIAIADAIRAHNNAAAEWDDPSSRPFDGCQIRVIADVLAKSNPLFNRERWLGYIAGINGPSGGKVDNK